MRIVRAFIGSLGLPITVGDDSTSPPDDLPSLFPNLRQLSVSMNPCKPAHGDVLAHLMSPKLEKLHVQFTPFRRTGRQVRMPSPFRDESEDWKVSPTLGEKAHFAVRQMRSPLRSLTINMWDVASRDPVLQIESLCSIPTLRSARVQGDLTSSQDAYAILRYLGSNLHLKHLASAATPHVVSPSAIDDPNARLGELGWFPALESFRGYNDSLTRIVSSSPACFTSLKKIDVTFNPRSRLHPLGALDNNAELAVVVQIQRFVDYVGSHCSGLEDVKLWACAEIDKEKGPISLQRLFTCKGMRRLVFDGPDPNMDPPTDEDIAGAADAWPLLEVLHWQGAKALRQPDLRPLIETWDDGIMDVVDPRPNATLKSLAKLSRQCPNLAEIDIDIDCQAPLSPDDCVHHLPKLRRITAERWYVTHNDTWKIAPVLAALAGPYPAASPLKATRKWVVKWVERDDYRQSEMWDELFDNVDEVRGVPYGPLPSASTTITS
ncbi:hypothetical protein FRB90_001037 [Tulasnella sp. 427]|nr:hypothetical protein FRB90_001037 [Tulasnella sp. 427]